MFQVLGCIYVQHDLRLVVLAGVLCAFASWTAMSLLARAQHTTGRARMIWLAAAGVVFGSGIWATHFVAMLAYSTAYSLGYDVGLTVLSILIAIAVSGLGFAIALRPGWGMAGGAIAGAAISAMHYTGMAAMIGPFDQIWDRRYVAASIVLGVGFSALAGHPAMSVRSIKGRSLVALLLTLGICAMHFTGMTALKLVHNPTLALADAILEPGTLAIAIAAIALLIVGMGLIGAMLDHHLAERASGEAERLRAHICELEETKSKLEATSARLSEALHAADTANQAKSQFLATMSHELRTPLNAVIGFSEMIIGQPFGPLGSQRYLDYMNDIRASGTHLLSLINDVLDISRLDVGQSDLIDEEIDVGALIRESARMTQDLAIKAAIDVHIDVPMDLPLLVADRRRTRQILLNILSNALKFTPTGGAVTVRSQVENGCIAIVIADTGIGIASEDIPRALERFGQIDARLSRKYEGVGLGLPLSRQLMELHGGSLLLESMPSVGTTVTLTFPAARSSAALRVA